MADNIQLDEGTSGKYAETVEVGTNIHRQVHEIGGVGACALVLNGTRSQEVTCTNANTDYTIPTALYTGTKYLVVYCASPVIVAMGQATSSTVGVYVPAGAATAFPVIRTGNSTTDKVHVRSQVTGAVVRFTEMSDA